MSQRVVRFAQSPDQLAAWLERAIPKLDLPVIQGPNGHELHALPSHPIRSEPDPYPHILQFGRPPAVERIRILAHETWPDPENPAAQHGTTPSVAEFTFRPLPDGRWEAVIKYHEALEPWIEALRRDAADGWIEPKAPPIEEIDLLERIPAGTSREIVRLWRQGLTAPEIGYRLNREAKTITNRIIDLRQAHGADVVPRRKPVQKSRQ